MAAAISGAPTFAKPVGSPWLRSVISVPPSTVSSHWYVVRIGNGPWAVLITNRLPGSCSTTA
jgi:hypothetical protein